MKRIAILVCTVVAVLLAAAAPRRAAGVSSPPPEPAREATFLTLLRGETLFVERVRDEPGGYDGEVGTIEGAVWFRYRVRFGPGGKVERYEMDMTSMVGARRGDIPRPVLVARHVGDSVIITAEPGMGWSDRRVAVTRTALMSSFETTSLEEQVRHGLSLRGATFAAVSPWVGQAWDMRVVPVRDDRVRLESSDGGVWELTLDRHRRILRGTGVRGGQYGLDIVRLEPERDHPLQRPLSIGERRESRFRNRLDSLRHAWSERESAFRATLESGRPIEERIDTLDRHIAAFADRGGVVQAEKCLEVAAAMRDDPDRRAVAERFARRAIACADSHNQRRFGDQGLTAVRARSHMMLAGIEAVLGRRDSALARLDQVMALPLELEFEGRNLRRDAQMTRAAVLERDRLDEAVAAMFVAVALDMGPDSVSATVTVPLRRMWRTLTGEDTSLAARIRNARTWQWAQAMMGGGARTLKSGQVPAWSCRDLTGRVRRSSELAGKPLLVLFWGGWSDLNRMALREAEAWHLRRASTGVEVITVNWELPGPGPLSERLARAQVSRDRIAAPVLLDHDRHLFEAFGAEAYPQLFLVDREGRMIRTSYGVAAVRDSLAERIAALGRPARR